MKFSVLLIDGFGNNLYQLSFLYQYARKHKVEHLISIRQWNDQIFGEPIFGGHPRKVPLFLNQIFPNIHYEEPKSIRDDDVCISFVKHDNQFHDWSLSEILSKTDHETTNFVFSGWFFNYKYHQNYRNDFIEWLTFSPMIYSRIPNIPYEQTISIHLRLGSPADTANVQYFDPNRILLACKVLKQEFPYLTGVLVCSEKQEKAEQYIHPDEWKNIGLEYHYLDEDVEVCLLASTKCAHHCLSNSTLSFMMAYLDEKLPEKSIAYYNSFTYTTHSLFDPKLEKAFRIYPEVSN